MKKEVFKTSKVPFLPLCIKFFHSKFQNHVFITPANKYFLLLKKKIQTNKTNFVYFILISHYKIFIVLTVSNFIFKSTCNLNYEIHLKSHHNTLPLDKQSKGCCASFLDIVRTLVNLRRCHMSSDTKCLS